MGQYLNYNGQLQAVESSSIEKINPASIHGEGVFETMRISNHKIVFEDYHFNRLFNGLRAMQPDINPKPGAAYLRDCIIQLCESNGNEKAARVRLTIYRNENIASGITSFVIESWELNSEYVFNDEGLTIGIYPHSTKNNDVLSLYKTTDYLPYRLAAGYARQHHLDDCLVLNAGGHICDSSISNVFWIKDQVVHTPPLSEACIDGVMRRYLLEKMHLAELTITELPLPVDTLSEADEVFLTNVIRGVCPVKQFGQVRYQNTLTRKIFNVLVAPLTKG